MCAGDSFSCVLGHYIARRPLTPELLPLASAISHLPCQQLIAYCHLPGGVLALILPKLPGNIHNFGAQCHQQCTSCHHPVVCDQRLTTFCSQLILLSL